MCYVKFRIYRCTHYEMAGWNLNCPNRPAQDDARFCRNLMLDREESVPEDCRMCVQIAQKRAEGCATFGRQSRKPRGRLGPSKLSQELKAEDIEEELELGKDGEGEGADDEGELADEGSKQAAQAEPAA